jgi:hypothetical protein
MPQIGRIHGSWKTEGLHDGLRLAVLNHTRERTRLTSLLALCEWLEWSNSYLCQGVIRFILVAIVTSTDFGASPVRAATLPVQVWYTPNNDTPDLVDLFREPQLWGNARSQISVLKLGPQQVGGGNSSGKNTISDLGKADAFHLLRSWGIDLAIEAPAIKPWDCTGKHAAERTLVLINNVAKAGGAVSYVSMDGPLVNGIRSCRDILDGAAAKTASYISSLGRDSPAIRVGDIEPYPYFTPNQILSWIRALDTYGAKPDHFHLDVDIHFLEVHPEVDLRSDLLAFRAIFRPRNIPFGIILWSGFNPVPSDQAYYQRTMAWAKRVHLNIGLPDQLIFESWVFRSSPRCTDADPKCALAQLRCGPSDPSGCGEKSVPVNLPEDNPTIFSHTRLINDAIKLLLQ